LDALEGGMAKNLKPPNIMKKSSCHVGIAVAWVCAAIAMEYVFITVGSKAGSMFAQVM
jgi:hypothetical protein